MRRLTRNFAILAFRPAAHEFLTFCFSPRTRRPSDIAGARLDGHGRQMRLGARLTS